MATFQHKRPLQTPTIFIVLLALQFTSCQGQEGDSSSYKNETREVSAQSPPSKSKTLFPQIHTNLNGMVREFVRTMYQDTEGNYWFGTNGNGIIRYDGHTLKQIPIRENFQGGAVREIAEDKSGNIWFGTSEGLVKYDGEKMIRFAKNEGLPDEEIWGLLIDKSGTIWVGTLDGVCQFDGHKFTPFPLPDMTVDNPQYMLSDKLVNHFLEDKKGTMWLVTDGNGIFKYRDGAFSHLTTSNGLTDNNTADILEDRHGNIWIGTYYGGVSKFDGKTYTNFTRDSIIQGVETYNLMEDRQGNIWFSAENFGVYHYDGTDFKQFTTEDGLTTNGVQSIMEDNKGQIWFGTWQGICLYDGHQFTNANQKEPWTN